MRQIAERLVRRGHGVTVATTKLRNRTFNEHNGVKIVEFAVTGNLVNGMSGDVQQYREFVSMFPCDALMIKAAQQWTFDALWQELDGLTCRKVFIPCGFSGLYEPSYKGYFSDIPDVLKKFDHLIFYAEKYRDVDFAKQHGITNYSVIPNGASEIEFGISQDLSFRKRHGISEDSFVLLTVGSITGVKGHRELLEAFCRYDNAGHTLTFIMNGNPPPIPDVAAPSMVASDGIRELADPLMLRLKRVFRQEGVSGLAGRVVGRLWKPLGRLARAGSRVSGVLQTEGLRGVRYRLVQRMAGHPHGYRLLNLLSVNIGDYSSPISFWLAEAKKPHPGKQLLVTDFDRAELVQAYMASNLFVFASNIEYSPLVLFESCAAGTPFLSVPVGNAEEIAQWTGGGTICSADKDSRGYTRANPEDLCFAIQRLARNPEQLKEMGRRAKASWEDRFTWEKISLEYEKILTGQQV